MPGIATGEVYAFAEGKLYLYASASGTTSGSGIAFARDATLNLAYGWDENLAYGGTWTRALTARRADLSISHLLADQSTFNIANGTACVNAKFEGLITAGSLSKSAQWTLYSGVIDAFSVAQVDGELFKCSISFHANEWTAIGQ